MQPSRIHSRTRGFTLIETALATVIVGTGVLAIVSAQQAFFLKNEWSTHASTAERLGNEFREMTWRLPAHDPVTGTTFWGPEPDETSLEDYDDLDDFDGEGGTGTVWSSAIGNGPVAAARAVIDKMEGWSQEVTVECVDPFDIVVRVDDNATDMIRMLVTVRFQGVQDSAPREMTRVSWIAPK
ncbi:MAG: hypothetical protein EXS10_00165 [Phycisphaerales bacterium]|nr:hypothetical protein [Phycisphaerales bacterium]